MESKNIIHSQEHQFGEVVDIILQHRSRASKAVNEEMLLTAWSVGSYVSGKLKSEEWGSKVVTQLSEYIRSHRPDLKGYSRSSIYNMVMFYDEYSSEAFRNTVQQFFSNGIVQPKTAQLTERDLTGINDIMQTESAQLTASNDEIVQFLAGQFMSLLNLTTLTNHVEILCRCRSQEERLFYILYAHKEHLVKRELQRCISNQTYATLLGNKSNMSKGMLEAYPDAPIMFKDTLFVDFLGLPKKHSETKLRNGLIEHMKQFILELGKDFIFMDQEYRLNVGASTYKADLLFFHRGLQALVAVELKKTKFHPKDLGQLEYAMNRCMSPTMIAEYKRILIPQERMQEQLREFCNFFMKNEKQQEILNAI
ncbi:PDDEXK nuclease domain-containing protein [uncultured Bacteroides sp.]|uniref:PDDEXK nuclease domain-containing protein n=1 Tax=uncultured Bacteroides sp. TaxID=162156 RepID=UPI00262A75AD|nr:PDDEXK nuclease domain-containing protein [uncultured Bacteroides sp.]